MKDIQNIKIREAKRSDIAEVGRILSENYHDTYANILDKRYLSSVNPESAASRMDDTSLHREMKCLLLSY